MKELNYDHLKLDNFFSFRSDLATNRKKIRKLTEENKENDGSFNGVPNLFSGRGKVDSSRLGTAPVNTATVVTENSGNVPLTKQPNNQLNAKQGLFFQRSAIMSTTNNDDRSNFMQTQHSTFDHVDQSSNSIPLSDITRKTSNQPQNTREEPSKSGFVDGSGERIPLSNLTNENDAQVFTRERCKPAENPRKVVASKMQRRITPTMDSITKELSFEDDLIHNDYDSAEFSTISDLQADEGDMFWDDEYEFVEVERLDAEENETEHNADGYHDEIPYVDSNTQSKKKWKRITMKEYYSYKLQVRKDEEIDKILKSIGKSLMQFKQLPQPPANYLQSGTNNLVIDETSYNLSEMEFEFNKLFPHCNPEQLEVYTEIGNGQVKPPKNAVMDYEENDIIIPPEFCDPDIIGVIDDVRPLKHVTNTTNGDQFFREFVVTDLINKKHACNNIRLECKLRHCGHPTQEVPYVHMFDVITLPFSNTFQFDFASSVKYMEFGDDVGMEVEYSIVPHAAF
ncbi:hypothetical protein POM88_008009 [Heracleum sosnowskyi]|uniref:Uncharacterized protein n=1 Tax=Heracleum sosnowskyi TaxID=360622 RepID=A0AAD8N715_9APIA|nr:hypothetical protein POM88_008009 [Heracleum sosnowskyi]